MGDPLRQRRIKTSAALLDHRKMETRCIRDCLEVIWGVEIIIVSRNGWKLPCTQPRDSLWEGVSKIGILRVAAVLRPPTGVHGELHEIGEPSNLLGTSRFTAGQGAELVQINCLCALRL